MKKIIHFVVLYFLCYVCYAQPMSNLQKGSDPKPGTTHILQLCSIAWAKMYSQPDTSVIVAKQGILLSRQLHFIKGEVASMDALAEAYNETGNYHASLQLSLQELRLAENMRDTPQICRALMAIASAYSFQHNTSLAIRYYYRTKAVAATHHYIGSLMTVYNNLSEEFEELHNLDAAKSYADECLRLAVTEKNIDFTGCAFTNLATVHMMLHQPVAAMKYYRKALPYFKQVDDHEYLCRCYVEMAAFFKQSGQMDSALYYGNLCMQMALRSHIAEWTLQGSDFLMHYYTAAHNIDSAAAYRNIYVAAKGNKPVKEKGR